jgi:F-type H+-transporting ATPase subunit delta
MRDSTIARNYAEALLTLATKAGDLPGWGRMFGEVAEAVGRDVTLRNFLESPRVSATQKNEIIAKAFGDRMPRLMVRFLQALVSNRRQMLIPEIDIEYRLLVDERENRVHARVSVAQETSEADERMIADKLSKLLGKQVIPHFTVAPEILGGVIVKVGDTVMDGSVRRRLATLRSRLRAGVVVGAES